MSNASKYRKKAVEYEQLKQFDRAVASYVRAIEENENASEEVDVALFNKVGDLTLRQGRVTEAVTYYERAVEHYVSNNLFDNAIALCNKILRNAPGRSNVYFTLGRICGRKGLRSDATRNFLEYATRMQQEGRVDEGMRALAEVADLMPELTEVRRLVEEHAARAGISLTRRRDTPPRATAQAEPEPSRMFGLSKDLVFLEIDYDAAKPARGKTPPPQRSVTPASVPVLDAVAAPAPVAAPISAPAAVPAAVASAVVATVAAPTIAAPAPVTPSARLEDLMIFDPRDNGSAAPLVDDDAAGATVVDGASILKPYVDPDTPVVSLADLEPTEFRATPADVAAIESAEPLADILQRGVSPRVAGVEQTPVESAIVVRVPTEPNFPAVVVDEDVVALDGVVSGISSQVFGEIPAAELIEEVLPATQPELQSEVAADVVSEAAPDVVSEVAADVVPETAPHVDDDALFIASFTPAPPVPDAIESVVHESVSETADAPLSALEEELPASNDVLSNSDELLSTSDNVLPMLIDAPSETYLAVLIDEESVSSVDDVSTPPLIESLDVVSAAGVSFDPTSHDIVNFALEHELNQSLPAQTLDGFTADEEATVAADFALAEPISELIATDEDVSIEVPVESGVMPSLDFDAMLESTHPEIVTVADLESEEFEPANDELAAARFVRLEAESSAALVDSFESDNELPPLIFPSSSDAAALDTPLGAIADVAFDATAVDEFAVDDFADDEVAFDAAELTAITLDDVDLAAIDLAVIDAAAIDLAAIDLAAIDLDALDLSTVPIDVVDIDVIDLNSDAAESAAASADLEAVALDAFDFVEPTPADGQPEVSDLVFLDVPATDPPALTPLEVESVVPSLADDDLDDLFGDAGIPTAVVAAEATLVASSRLVELQTASNADPENFVLRRRLAEALFEAGDRDAAIIELGAALAGAELVGALNDAADISDELVRVARDEAAHHQKRLELAIRLGEQTRLRVAYLDFADNLVRRGEDLRAKAVYARVLEMDPFDDRARTALGDAAPPPPSRTVAAGTDDGHVSLADWLREDDEPTSTRLRMREPDVTGDEQDDFNALLKHFKEGVARSLGEDDYESHYDLGVAYKEMGLLDDAIGEFQMALRSRNNRLAAYEALGQCFLEQQSYKVAVTVLSRALHEPAIQDEQRVGILYLLGYSCEVLQRFDEARSYFQRVYATDIHFRDVAQRLADLERTVR